MMFRMLLATFALSVSSSLWANTLDFALGLRRASVNEVEWKATEIGFSYLIDLNEALALGPYLSSSDWDIRNDRLQVDSSGDHREYGPEIRFTAPLETLNFMAGASYSLVSTGTAKTEGGQTADLSVRGLRFKIGLGLPFESGAALNVWLIKGVQTVELESDAADAREQLDDLALAVSLSF